MPEHKWQNKVILGGTIKDEPDTKTIPSGKTVCNFTLQQGCGKGRGYNFWRCVAWEAMATVMAQYGDRAAVTVEGYFGREKDWTGRDRKVRYGRPVIVVQSVEPIGVRQAPVEWQAESPAPDTETNPPDDGNMGEDGTIPF